MDVEGILGKRFLDQRIYTCASVDFQREPKIRFAIQTKCLVPISYVNLLA